MLYPEEAFNRLICLERKRVERSRLSLMLAILDVTQITDDKRRGRALTTMKASIPRHIRETDFCGWMRSEDLLGVIFTEIPRAEAVQARQTVEVNIRRFLKEILDEEVYGLLRLSVFLFPDEGNEKKQEEEFKSFFYPDLVKKDQAVKIAEGIKRVMDLAGAAMALLLFSPFFIAVPILIKVTSPGPVLFRQQRLGLYGRFFTLYKFRSMYIDTDDSIHREFVKDFISAKEQQVQDQGNAVFKIQHDPRLTPVGGFIRKFSIDELPQFLNVLKGEMSLVGPRPPIPYEVESYDLWHRFRILAKKPGITGLWQVKGRSLTTFDGMVRLDLQYIREWSLWLDLKLILATPLAVIRGKGAY